MSSEQIAGLYFTQQGIDTAGHSWKCFWMKPFGWLLWNPCARDVKGVRMLCRCPEEWICKNKDWIFSTESSLVVFSVSLNKLTLILGQLHKLCRPTFRHKFTKLTEQHEGMVIWRVMLVSTHKHILVCIYYGLTTKPYKLCCKTSSSKNLHKRKKSSQCYENVHQVKISMYYSECFIITFRKY